jgi:hypothetical protein
MILSVLKLEPFQINQDHLFLSKRMAIRGRKKKWENMLWVRV